MQSNFRFCIVQTPFARFYTEKINFALAPRAFGNCKGKSETISHHYIFCARASMPSVAVSDFFLY